VWAFARDNSFVIMSKDDDFHQRSFRFGHPPKIVWLRIGNCPTAQIASLLRAHVADIVDFNNDPAASFLALR
jgi:predicted nuclease of predicted toxin-antitoxin system